MVTYSAADSPPATWHRAAASLSQLATALPLPFQLPIPAGLNVWAAKDDVPDIVLIPPTPERPIITASREENRRLTERFFSNSSPAKPAQSSPPSRDPANLLPLPHSRRRPRRQEAEDKENVSPVPYQVRRPRSPAAVLAEKKINSEPFCPLRLTRPPSASKSDSLPRHSSNPFRLHPRDSPSLTPLTRRASTALTPNRGGPPPSEKDDDWTADFHFPSKETVSLQRPARPLTPFRPDSTLRAVQPLAQDHTRSSSLALTERTNTFHPYAREASQPAKGVSKTRRGAAQSVDIDRLKKIWDSWDWSDSSTRPHRQAIQQQRSAGSPTTDGRLPRAPARRASIAPKEEWFADFSTPTTSAGAARSVDDDGGDPNFVIGEWEEDDDIWEDLSL